MVSSRPSRAVGRTWMAAASDELATCRVPPSPALHCRCREVRVLGLKKTVGAEVFDLVLVERNEHLMEVVEAIRPPDDLRQPAHQLALPVDWETGGASNLDEDPGPLGLDCPFLAARDFEHRRVTDILIGHLVDVHAVVGHLVRVVEDVQRSLDQLLLGFRCESRRTQDRDYGHGFFSFTARSPRRYLPPSSRLVPIPFKVRANALRSPTNRSGSSIAAKWPPRSNSLQCTMFEKARSAKRRMGRTISCGKTATPSGTLSGGGAGGLTAAIGSISAVST